MNNWDRMRAGKLYNADSADIAGYHERNIRTASMTWNMQSLLGLAMEAGYALALQSVVASQSERTASWQQVQS